MNGLKTPMPMIEKNSTLAKQVFSALQTLIAEVSGIKLQARDHEQLIRQATTLANELGIDDINKLAPHLKHNKAALQQLVELITTHETSFFRDQIQFDFLESWLAKQPQRSNIIAWSSACATGEETYSISMLLDAADTVKTWKVIGTDISKRVLKLASHATYPKRESSGIKPQLYRTYCTIGHGPFSGFFSFKSEITRFV